MGIIKDLKLAEIDKDFVIRRYGYHLGIFVFKNGEWHFQRRDHSMYRCSLTDINTETSCFVKAVEKISY